MRELIPVWQEPYSTLQSWNGAEGLWSMAERTGERSRKETAGTASWEMGRYLDGTARSRGGRDNLSYDVAHPGRPHEAAEEEAV